MKTILVGADDAPEIWADMLRPLLPDHRILTAPPPPGEAVAHVVVGFPPPGLIARLTGLELVLSLNAGVEGLLAGGEVPEGTPIVRMVEPGLTQGMVEWVLAQVLAFHRNLFAYAADQLQGAWAPRAELMASERTVAVLGAGALGRPTAEALAWLGFKTRAWSRSPQVIARVEGFAGGSALGAALEGADILVNLLPLTAETADILNAKAFARLAPGAFLVNAGRGGHLVEDDLLDALQSGRLSGAALDVFRAEPLASSHPFWAHPRIRISPHVAAPTFQRTAAAVVAERIRRWERGEPLEHLVDRARGY